MTERICEKQGCKDNYGNCLISGTDNLPVQCVGPWVENKYYFLERYLKASSEARRKFADRGNAIFIDLFAGPGKCIIRDEKREIESGSIRALLENEVPFNEYFYFDISERNVESLKKRIGTKPNCNIECGDSNILIEELSRQLSERPLRYHFAFIDPFGPDGLKFETLASLAKLKRMDMLLHFPIGAIKRNLKVWIGSRDTILDEFLGTNEWRKKIKSARRNAVFSILIETFKGQLQKIGYPEEGLKLASSDRSIYSDLPTVPIKNTKEVGLYVLILISKHPLGQKIWNSVIRISPDGQKSLF